MNVNDARTTRIPEFKMEMRPTSVEIKSGLLLKFWSDPEVADRGGLDARSGPRRSCGGGCPAPWSGTRGTTFLVLGGVMSPGGSLVSARDAPGGHHLVLLYGLWYPGCERPPPVRGLPYPLHDVRDPKQVRSFGWMVAQSSCPV